jgi:hypothetical protein
VTPARIVPAMATRSDDEREALTDAAERLAAAYQLLLLRNGPALDPAMEAVFGALASIDLLAGGLTSPSVRATLDPT